MDTLLQPSPLTVAPDAIADKNANVLARVRRDGRWRLAEIFAYPRGPLSAQIVAATGQVQWRIRRSALRTPGRFRVEVTEGSGRPVGTVRLQRLGVTSARFLCYDGSGELIGHGRLADQTAGATSLRYEFKDADGADVATSKYPVRRAPHQVSFNSRISADLRALVICLVTTLPNRRLGGSAPVSPLLGEHDSADTATGLLRSTSLTFQRSCVFDGAGNALAVVDEPHVSIRRGADRFASVDPGLGAYGYVVRDPSGRALFGIDKSGWTRDGRIDVTNSDGVLIASVKKTSRGTRKSYTISNTDEAAIGEINQVAALTQEYTTLDAADSVVAACTRATAVNQPWTIRFADGCGDVLTMATLAFIVVTELQPDL